MLSICEIALDLLELLSSLIDLLLHPASAVVHPFIIVFLLLHLKLALLAHHLDLLTIIEQVPFRSSLLIPV